MFAILRGQRIGELFDWWVGQDLVPTFVCSSLSGLKCLDHVTSATVLSARSKMMREMFDVLNAVKLKL